MTERLSTQTGFVPESGTEVKIVRLMNVLWEKRQQKPRVLFIDFSNAYNTNYHNKLFLRLREKSIRRARNQIPWSTICTDEYQDRKR